MNWRSSATMSGDCSQVYSEPEKVHYAKDAFAGLRLTDSIIAAKRSAAGCGCGGHDVEK